MSFAAKDFASRLGTMGDEAERVFEEVHDKGWAVWGLRRPKLHVPSLTAYVRHAPDYITAEGFVEVGSIHKERVLKLKVQKHICLLQWNNEMPTRLFVWDSPEDRYTYLGMDQLTESIASATLAHFPEGTPYWAIPVDALGAEWVQRSPSSQST